MQIQAFASLLEKYQDFNTNPGAEKLERIVQRMREDFTIQAELLYLQDTGWTLDTIKQELKLCRLYEKMGYKPTGEEFSPFTYSTRTNCRKKPIAVSRLASFVFYIKLFLIIYD